MIELVDCHTHSNFSDGDSALRENALAARALGLTTLCCTDHWGRPSWVDCTIEEVRLGEYGTAIAEVQAEFDDLQIVHSLECDWYEGCLTDIAETRGDATFLLGSIHYLDEMAIDWSGDMRSWEQRGADWIWRNYVEQWCLMAQSRAFDSLSHPDLPRLFWKDYRPSFDLAPLHDEMVAAAKESGARIEVSVAGVAKGLGDYYPECSLLAKFAAAGVPVTVGTDAHQAGKVGQGIAELYAHLHGMGYRKIEVPCPDGSWRTVSL